MDHNTCPHFVTIQSCRFVLDSDFSIGLYRIDRAQIAPKKIRIGAEGPLKQWSSHTQAKDTYIISFYG